MSDEEPTRSRRGADEEPAGPDLGDAAAYATAAVAMGAAALDWLPTLQGHGYVAIDDRGRCFHGGRPPITLAA